MCQHKARGITVHYITLDSGSSSQYIGVVVFVDCG